jgi:hypothetical protein
LVVWWWWCGRVWCDGIWVVEATTKGEKINRPSQSIDRPTNPPLPLNPSNHPPTQIIPPSLPRPSQCILLSLPPTQQPFKSPTHPSNQVTPSLLTSSPARAAKSSPCRSSSTRRSHASWPCPALGPVAPTYFFWGCVWTGWCCCCCWLGG